MAGRKRFTASWEIVCALFANGVHAYSAGYDVPPDSTVESITTDPHTRKVEVTVTHDSFEETPEGSEIPLVSQCSWHTDGFEHPNHPMLARKE